MRGIVQIKTGSTPVDLVDLAAATTDDATDTFAYATCGTYQGDEKQITEIIRSEDLLEFASDQPDLLPLRVRTWFELAGD